MVEQALEQEVDAVCKCLRKGSLCSAVSPWGSESTAENTLYFLKQKPPAFTRENQQPIRLHPAFTTQIRKLALQNLLHRRGSWRQKDATVVFVGNINPGYFQGIGE